VMKKRGKTRRLLSEEKEAQKKGQFQVLREFTIDGSYWNCLKEETQGGEEPNNYLK